MARLPRLTLAGLPHVVCQATVHGQPLAVDDVDRQALLAALAAAAAAQHVALWGYALAPQALHLVLCPPTADALGRTMQTLGRRYVGPFNRRHGRQGALWGGRFRAAVLEPGPWVLTALRHVDQLVPGPWSSAAHHLGHRRDPLLADPPELWALGNTPFERETAYRALLAQPVPADEAERLARAVHGAWALGSPEFVARVSAVSGRPAAPRRPGRPARHPPVAGEDVTLSPK